MLIRVNKLENVGQYSYLQGKYGRIRPQDVFVVNTRFPGTSPDEARQILTALQSQFPCNRVIALNGLGVDPARPGYALSLVDSPGLWGVLLDWERRDWGLARATNPALSKWKRHFGRSINRLGSVIGQVAGSIQAAGTGIDKVGAAPSFFGDWQYGRIARMLDRNNARFGHRRGRDPGGRDPGLLPEVPGQEPGHARRRQGGSSISTAGASERRATSRSRSPSASTPARSVTSRSGASPPGVPRTACAPRSTAAAARSSSGPLRSRWRRCSHRPAGPAAPDGLGRAGRSVACSAREHLRADRRAAAGDRLLRARGPGVRDAGLRAGLTTVIHLKGGGEEGVGEDVVYDALDHIAFQDAGPVLELAGEHTIDSFSKLLEGLDLFPTPPEREVSVNYRRWAFESAALDLALRQAGKSLHEVLGREPKPVTFVVSMRLGAVPSSGGAVDASSRSKERLAVYPTLRFKLDPTNDWTDELIAQLVETGAVDSLDLKGLYKGTPVDVETDPVLYEKLIEAFPDAWLEDPDVNDETKPILDPVADRVTWDAPIHSVADIEAQPWPPKMVNIKPSRFGPAERAVRRLRPLRREGDRRLRRRPVGARARPRPHPVPGLDLPPRHPERRRAVGLQHPDGDRARAARPARSTPRRARPASAGASDGRGRPNLARYRLTPWPENFADALNKQIANEFAASQQYIGAAVYYDSETLPRLAAFFYRQAVEERNHAMIMVQYLLDTERGGADPRHQVAADRLRRHRRAGVDGARAGEAGQARRSRSCSSSPARRQLLRRAVPQWFIKEQVEEVASMTDLLERGRARQGQPAAWRGVPGPRADRRRGRRPDRAARRRRRPLETRPGARARLLAGAAAASPRGGRTASVWRSSMISARTSSIAGSASLEPLGGSSGSSSDAAVAVRGDPPDAAPRGARRPPRPARGPRTGPPPGRRARGRRAASPASIASRKARGAPGSRVIVDQALPRQQAEARRPAGLPDELVIPPSNQHIAPALWPQSRIPSCQPRAGSSSMP